MWLNKSNCVNMGRELLSCTAVSKKSAFYNGNVAESKFCNRYQAST